MPAVAEDPSGSEASSSEDDTDEEDRPELDDEDVDNLAANMGIERYSVMLRRVEKQEAEFAAGNVKRAKCAFLVVMNLPAGCSVVCPMFMRNSNAKPISEIRLIFVLCSTA